MKLRYLPGLLGLIFSTAAQAQSVGIGTASPNAAAALEVSSPANNQGFLPPRLTYAQRTGISNAVAGLLVYQSSTTPSPAGYYYYTGLAWLPLLSQGDNLGTHTATQDLNLNGNQLSGGTSNNVGIVSGQTLELGNGVAGKEANAGKIGYNAFGSGALDVVGAGTSNTTRKIKLWAEGGTELNGPLKIGGGGPGAGKVLTSDADGDATWQTSAGLATASNGLTASGTNVKLGGTLTETTAIVAGSASQQLRLETPVPVGGLFINSLDQQQLANNTEAVIRTSGGVATPVAQTFVPEYTGNTVIVRVRVRATGYSAGAYSTTTLTLEVLAGAAGTTGGTVLTTTTANVGAGDGQQVNVDFVPGVSLVGGQTYTLRVSGAGTFNGVAEWFWRGASGNPYAAGASSAGSGTDQYFQTLVEPAAGTGLRLRGGGTEITGAAQVWGPLTAQDDLAVAGTATLSDLTVNGRLRLPTYSQGFFGSNDINGTTSVSYTWTHNFGYKPVLMTSMDGTGGNYASRVVVSYTHLDNNTVRFELANVYISAASGTLRWVVVGP